MAAQTAVFLLRTGCCGAQAKAWAVSLEKADHLFLLRPRGLMWANLVENCRDWLHCMYPSDLQRNAMKTLHRKRLAFKALNPIKQSISFSCLPYWSSRYLNAYAPGPDFAVFNVPSNLSCLSNEKCLYDISLLISFKPRNSLSCFGIVSDWTCHVEVGDGYCVSSHI